MVLIRSLSIEFLWLSGLSTIPVVVRLADGHKITPVPWALFVFVILPALGIMGMFLSPRTRSKALGWKVRRFLTPLISFWIPWIVLLTTVVMIQSK